MTEPAWWWPWLLRMPGEVVVLAMPAPVVYCCGCGGWCGRGAGDAVLHGRHAADDAGVGMLDAPVLDAAGVERGGGAVLERAVGGDAIAHRQFVQAGTTVVAALELRRGRHGHGDRGAARLHRQRGRPGRATKRLQDAIHRVALMASVRGSVAEAVVMAEVV